MFFTAIGCTVSCSDKSSTDPVASAHAEVVNGYVHPDPPNSGVVQLLSAGFDTSSSITLEAGSGTLLSADWVLTAGHVVYNAASPGDVTVRRGNSADSSAEIRHGKRIEIHPGYEPVAGGNPNFSVDIALVQLDAPFSSAAPKAISNLSTSQITALPQTRCMGYGQSANCTSASGELRFGDFEPFPATPGTQWQFAVPLNSDNQVPHKGDSGGPCLNPTTGDILGVLRTSQFVCPLDPAKALATAVAPDAFRDWVSFARTTIASAYIDFDHDWKLDWVGFTQFEARVFFAAGGAPLSIPLPGGVNIIANATVALGNFNNDIWPDLVVSAGGLFQYVPRINLGFGPPSLVFTPIASDYSAFVSHDVNGDGFDDLEATRPNGVQDLYFGSATGLDSGMNADGWPTTDGNDGKFLALVSNAPGLSTPENSWMTFWIVAEKDQPFLDVQLFDGDMSLGSKWDVGDPAGVTTCYNLWFLPEADPASPNVQLIAARSSGEFEDDKWERLTVEERVDNQAYSASSTVDYSYYMLDVYLANNGDCYDLSQVTVPVINPFKVRSTGQISMGSGDLAFLGGDVAGDFVSTDKPSDQVIRDTTYDGDFMFWFYVPPGNTEALLDDADADIRIDDVPDGTRGPNDIKADGVATGVSDTISYRVYDANGNVVLTNTNPSGNNDGATQTDREELKAAVAEGWWIWNWRGVYTHNDVRIWVPFASPTQYAMFTRQSDWRSPSIAISPDGWIVEGVEQALLPTTLGSGNNAIVVATVVQAEAMLSGTNPACGGAPPGKQTVCHGIALGSGKTKLITIADAAVPAHLAHGDDVGAPALMSELATELLAAKLNISAANKIGQRLEEASVYGATLTVSEVVVRADAVVRAGVTLCSLSSGDREEINELLALLRSINAGFVTFVPLHGGGPLPLGSGLVGPSISSVAPPPSQPAGWTQNF